MHINFLTFHLNFWSLSYVHMLCTLIFFFGSIGNKEYKCKKKYDISVQKFFNSLFADLKHFELAMTINSCDYLPCKKKHWNSGVPVSIHDGVCNYANVMIKRHDQTSRSNVFGELAQYGLNCPHYELNSLQYGLTLTQYVMQQYRWESDDEHY